METKNMTCVVCPRGCALTVTVDGDTIVSVTGNTCKRGAAYAEAELLHPERMLTTTVAVDGRSRMLAVRTRTAIPKDKIFDIMHVLYTVKAQAPVHIGDVIVPDVCGTGVDVVASQNMA